MRLATMQHPTTDHTALTEQIEAIAESPIGYSLVSEELRNLFKSADIPASLKMKCLSIIDDTDKRRRAFSHTDRTTNNPISKPTEDAYVRQLETKLVKAISTASLS